MNFVSLYPIECEQTELKNMENPFEEQQNKLQRPTFLLVLCILTFIGSGWGTLSNLFSVFTAGLTNSSMQMEHYSSMLNGMDQGGDSAVLSDILSSTMASLQATFVHAKEIAVINLVLSVISLLGAILMFQLRRIGFYFYTAAQILMLFVLPYFAGFTCIGLLLAILLIKPLNALLLGEMYAANLGIKIRRTRILILLCTGLLTATTTAFCGPISFIGLAVPHVARLMLGSSNHKMLVPVTLLTGSCIALLCNLLMVLPGTHNILPLNAVTPMLGAPVIIYVIVNRKNIQYFD